MHNNGLYSTLAPMVTPILAQGEPSPMPPPEMLMYPALVKNRGLGQRAVLTFCSPVNFATSSPITNEPSLLKPGLPGDPATWSVDDVILFLKGTEPQMFSPLAGLFKEHAIDGKAVILLKSGVMMKHMGLNLGMALKLCCYIERLKEEKRFN
ncbi:sex comb on midleg-like protein 1 [Erinaceus europaeus]|uniref:Sex comb on midleg-like protein 1 n=1 Tax=Erinaceus europaeus TaxID=9365 RepID=A0ABM3WQW3_ERIEU|nr:sex comb on midleg-like protein 1 [Erinaceus europaeus]